VTRQVLAPCLPANKSPAQAGAAPTRKRADRQAA
jgi:hypothetical protein